MSVKDADSHAEYCLECIRKHLDTAFINLGEIEQRLIYKPEPDTKVREKVKDIISDIEAAEKHALDNVQTSAKEKAVLGELTNAFRKTRKLLETTKLGYRDPRIKPVGGLADVQLAKELIDKHRGQVDFAIGEIGCGDCDTTEAEMSLISMRKTLKKELLKPYDLPVEVSGEEIRAQASFDPDSEVTQIAVIDEDTEKIQIIAQAIPIKATKVIVEEIPESGVTTIKLEGVKEGATVITDLPRGEIKRPKTLVQEKITKAAKDCETNTEPMVCVTKYANDIINFKKERKDPVIPTSSQMIDRIYSEMKQ